MRARARTTPHPTRAGSPAPRVPGGLNWTSGTTSSLRSRSPKVTPTSSPTRSPTAILDAIIKDDPYGRVACETLVTTGLAFVAGEITTETYVDIPKIVRQTVKDVGYTSAHFGYDYETCGVMVAIDEQSPDISQGVDARPSRCAPTSTTTTSSTRRAPATRA